jgi:hypothetical protein
VFRAEERRHLDAVRDQRIKKVFTRGEATALVGDESNALPPENIGPLFKKEVGTCFYPGGRGTAGSEGLQNDENQEW